MSLVVAGDVVVGQLVLEVGEGFLGEVGEQWVHGVLLVVDEERP
ncbi:hypothetical protein N5K55_25440 [Pseudomonas aeruginosa]|nr:hypothetical protein [Pseudomonas aeruginosa]